MPAFPKPAFTYNYQVAAQIAALRHYEQTKPGRNIPDKAPDRLLLASWNVANLGLHERRDKDYQVIAEMISWFDLVAIQETNDNLSGLRAVQQHLPAQFWLNNFDGVLTEFYLAEGFEIEATLPWSDEYAPSGWKYERFGRPNYVEMRHTTQAVQHRTRVEPFHRKC